MALDIYAGPLVRYYRGDWETVGQQWSRTTGIPLKVIRTSGEPDPPPPVEELQGLLAAWQRYLNEGLAENLTNPISWEEDPLGEYSTDRPGHDCYGALLLWAAYAEQSQLSRPMRARAEYWEDPAFKASTAEGFRSRYGQLLHDVEIWLPCDFEFTFRGAHLGEGDIGLGSSPALLRQMQKLNESTWCLAPDDLQSALEAGVDKDAPFEQVARFGFGIVEKLAKFSVEHRVPMKLDY